MKKLLVSIFLIVPALLLAETVVTERVFIPNPVAFGVGIERFNTTTDVLNTFSFLFDNRSYNFRIGGNVGFADSFDDLIVGPKAQYLFYGKKYFELFTQAGVYYRRHFRVGDGLTSNLMAGIDFAIPTIEMLHISLAYGIVWDAIDQNDISMNHGDVFGNLGIHYFF